MKVATTKQFRSAVRQALMERGYYYTGSWTDAPKWSDASDTNVRTVAFRVPLYVSYWAAARVEKILAEQDLTANSRATGGLSPWSGAYVRGTCKLT